MVSAVDLDQVTDYDLVFMGYWVDKGTADATAQEAMAKIKGKPVAIFSTSGAYPDSQHAKASLERGASCFGKGCTVLGSFICQGAVDPEFIQRAMERPPDHHHAPSPERIKRWHDAASHPDETDLENATAFARGIMEGFVRSLTTEG